MQETWKLFFQSSLAYHHFLSGESPLGTDSKLEMIGNLEAFWLLRLLLGDFGVVIVVFCFVVSLVFCCVSCYCVCGPVVGGPWSCVL